MNRQTVGKTVSDTYSTKQYEHELGELLPGESARYLKELHSGVDKGKKMFNTDFYIEVVIKKERLMPQILPRIWALPRHTCPTPFYDQDCYVYRQKDDVTEFIWSIPSPETAQYLRENKVFLDQDSRELYKFVCDYDNKVLYKLMKILNNEKEDSIELENFTFKG